MRELSILIPYRDGDPWRRYVWNGVRRRFENLLPEAELIVADDAHDHGDLFNHGQAINRAAEQATREILLIGDADTTFNVYDLQVAIEHVYDTGDWALPEWYVQLNRTCTQDILSRTGTSPIVVRPRCVEWRGERVSWSGLVLVPRHVFEAVGGSDERYAGHGADDVALAMKLETLYRPVHRFEGSALHLWHKRGVQERDEHRFHDQQRELTEAYMEAHGDEERMRVVAGIA